MRYLILYWNYRIGRYELAHRDTLEAAQAKCSELVQLKEVTMVRMFDTPLFTFDRSDEDDSESDSV
jgi:hypothetical protein